MPVVGSMPMVPRKIPKAPAISPLIMDSPTREMTRVIPSAIRAKYSGRAETDREVGQRRRQEHQANHAQGPGDEGADGRNPQRRAGPALPGHLVAVQAGHDRGGFARKVHQDGGGRAAVHGPVIDAGQHDDGGGGIHAEGEGNEHGRPGHRPDAGQDPDDRPHGHAEKAEEEIDGRNDRNKTRNQVFNHVLRSPFKFPETRWAAEISATAGKWRRGRTCRAALVSRVFKIRPLPRKRTVAAKNKKRGRHVADSFDQDQIAHQEGHHGNDPAAPPSRQIGFSLISASCPSGFLPEEAPPDPRSRGSWSGAKNRFRCPSSSFVPSREDSMIP